MSTRSTSSAQKRTASRQASASPKAAPAPRKASRAAAPQAPATQPEPAKLAPAEAPSKGKSKKQATAPAAKIKKIKVVRDSFTIPKDEFMQLAEMKKRALAQGLEIKKSELLRAGLKLLAGANDAGFKKALAAVPTLKTGRPGKD
jgi:hypothetical protein